MPEQLTKHPEVTLDVLRSAGLVCGERGRWKYRSPPQRRRVSNSFRHRSAAGRSMKFMLFAITSRCFGESAGARRSRSWSPTCETAPK